MRLDTDGACWQNIEDIAMFKTAKAYDFLKEWPNILTKSQLFGTIFVIPILLLIWICISRL